MKEIVWDESLSVEIDEIDEDHKRLVDLFNILSHAVEQGDEPDYIEAVLEELISCTVWHFRHEERLMLRYQYEGVEEHKAEHQALIDSARALQQRFQEETNLLNSEGIEFLAKWLTEHILGQDMKLGFFLMKEM